MSDKVVAEEEPKKKPCCQSKANKKLIKISDLPIYGNPYPKCDRIVSEELGYIETGVRAVRQEITPYVDIAIKSSQRLQQILNTSYEHSKSTYEYISSEGNTVAKAAVITGGGLLGLLIASRKGFFKKVFYTTAGLTAGSAACYPTEAKELSQIGFFIVKTKGPEIIKEYTGVDLSRKKGSKESSTKADPKDVDTIGKEVSDVQYYGFRVSESWANKTTNGVQKKSESAVKGDFGMSRKEDQDLYANRSSK
ncbi:unnamed protein product [Medioppia subpectinata]|uniref:MICOS complex subunit n=1 Tax=Medioppia subpectinata TaxID=1979941 RepID=A0A7R9L3B9_9ACAR|nr:unnamed protein product [Medioppia subpectinata]CAG2114551.1 unnamed protein product [Medioppia subpectinata]